MPDADGNPTAEETAAAAATTPDTAAAADAATADLQARLDQVTARAFDLEIAALRRDNPDLPDAAFAGDDLAAVQNTVTTARAAADHVRQQIEAAANGAAPNPAAAIAAAATPGAGVTRQPVTPPEGTKGLNRILYGLETQGAK